MKFFSNPKFFIFLTVVLVSTACVGNENTNANQTARNINKSEKVNNNASVVKDDVAELSRIINLPFEPDETSSVWREIVLNPQSNSDRVPGPTDVKLIAVLKFKPEDAVEIVKKAETYKPSVPVSLDAENWFPAELIAKSQASGDETIKGNSYAANDFLKSPYTDGKLTRIVDTDYFVLELFAL